MSGFVRGGPHSSTASGGDESHVLVTEVSREVVTVADTDPQLIYAIEPVVVGDVGAGSGVLLDGDIGVRVAGLVDGTVPLAQLPAQVKPKLAHTHLQSMPSTVWLIAHGLPFDPAAVEVVEHTGTVHYPQITYPSDLLVQLRFRRDVRGIARLS